MPEEQLLQLIKADAAQGIELAIGQYGGQLKVSASPYLPDIRYRMWRKRFQMCSLNCGSLETRY